MMRRYFALRFLPLRKTVMSHAQAIYVVTWMGVIVVILTIPSLRDSILQSISSLSFITLLDLLAVWTALIAIVYVRFGDNSTQYRTYIKPHHEIGISFLLTVLFTFVLLDFTYNYISNRVAGLLAPRQVLAAHLDNAASVLVQLDEAIKNRTIRTPAATLGASSGCSLAGTNQTFGVGSSITSTTVLQPPPSESGGTPTPLSQPEINAICEYLQIASSSTERALDLYEPVETTEAELFHELQTPTPIGPSTSQPMKVSNQLGVSLKWTKLAGEDSLSMTKSISDTLVKIDSNLAQVAGSPAYRATAVSSLVENDLLPRVERARAASARAAQAVHGVDVDVRPIFLGTASLLVLFVLFPWFLLLLFFLRKRTSLSSDIVKDLIGLAPGHALLKRVLGLTDVEVMEDIAVKDRSEKRDQIPTLVHSDFDDSRIDEQQITLQVQLLKSVSALPEKIGEKIRADKIETGVTAFQIVSQAVADRAFSDLEYVLSVTLLSAALSVGWYFVLFPNTSIGLSLLILENSGILGFTRYLVMNLTAITAGFVGAYLWSAFMLLRRYYYGDLYPTAYLAALERMIRVFILTLILAVLAKLVTGDNSSDNVLNPVINGVAFFIGIFPQVGLTFLGDLVNRSAQSRFPPLSERAPLTELEGLNYFVEGRLLEENVENIQGMATAQIEDLVVDTYFPAKRIVDWIDQAVLYIHCGRNGEWLPLLRGAGIRTATDLMDALGYDLRKNPPLGMESQAETDKRVRQLVEAVRDGQATKASPQITPAERVHHDAALYWEKMVVILTSIQELKKLEQALPNELSVPDVRQHAPDTVARLRESNNQLVTALEDFFKCNAELRRDLNAWDLGAMAKGEIGRRLDDATQAGRDVQSATTSLEAELDSMNLDDADSLKPDATWRDAVKKMTVAAEALYDRARDAYDLILMRYAPPPLTKEILLEIYGAVWPDPNMSYILNWHAGALP